MQENEEEKIIKEIYREYLSRELSRPEIQEGKKQFLSTFYTPAPAPLFSVGFFVPAFAMVALLFFFAQVQTKHFALQGPAVPIYRMFGTIMEEAKALEAARAAEAELKAQKAQADFALENPVLNHMKPRVVVQRISSRVGPTMVYQKAYRRNPVTIIWVFTGGQHA